MNQNILRKNKYEIHIDNKSPLLDIEYEYDTSIIQRQSIVS